MDTVNVSGLKNNPSEALRKARKDLVVVMKHNRPDALLVGLDSAGLLEGKGVRPALATALFRDGHLSLVRAADLAGMPVADFAAHLSRLGIPVVRLADAEVREDMDTLDEWLGSS
jgi:prevent-host-death family protein